MRAGTQKSRLTLEVRYDNAHAIALYEKLGFRQFGEHEDYYADGATALRYTKTVCPEDRHGDRRRSPTAGRKRKASVSW